MGKIIVAIIIGIVLIGVGLTEQIVLKNYFDNISSKCEELELLIATMDSAVYEKTQELYDWFNEKKDVMELFTPHAEIKDLSIRISELLGYVLINDQKSSMATLYIVKEISGITPHFFGVHWEHVL